MDKKHRRRHIANLFNQLGYSIAKDHEARCKKYGGLCDDPQAPPGEGDFYQGKQPSEEEIERFIGRFENNNLGPEEVAVYTLWRDEGRLDPAQAEFERDTFERNEFGKPVRDEAGGFVLMPQRVKLTVAHKRRVLRNIYKRILREKGQLYCRFNCKFGEILELTRPYKLYLNAVRTYICPAQAEFGIFSPSEIPSIMEKFMLDCDDSEEIFFVKLLMSSFYDGQMKAQHEDMKEREREAKKRAEQNKK